MPKNIAIITGASTGLGLQFAKQIEQNYLLDEIWLVARNRIALENLGTSFQKAKARCFDFDLTMQESLQKIAGELKIANPNIIFLVNNAGFGKVGKFSQLNKAEQLGMIDLNIRALTELTYICLPFMKKGSAILQIASSAGFAPAPYFAVYAATKAFVLNFSLALNFELKNQGIHVMSVCPGPVNTNFHSVAYAGNRASPGFNQFLSSQAADVVQTALGDLRRGKTVSIHGFLLKFFVYFSRLIPQFLLLKILAKRGGSTIKAS